MTALGELGLSSYEEKVYRGLLTLGSGTAREASDASDVPMGRIYDVLNGLEARDVVRSQSSTDPTTYVAVDPDLATERLLGERRRELDARKARYERVADEVASELGATTPTTSRFWSAPVGSDAATALVGELYGDAEETVRSAMGHPYEAADWNRYREEITAFEDCLDGGQTASVLATRAVLAGIPAEVQAEYVESADRVEVRVTDDVPVTFDVVDGTDLYLTVPNPLDAAERLGVVHVDDESVAATLDDLFVEAWAEATPLEQVGVSETSEKRARDETGGASAGASQSPVRKE